MSLKLVAPEPVTAVATHLPSWRVKVLELKWWFLRRLPRLVWLGDEVDVLVAMPYQETLNVAEDALRQAGITFDRGTWLIDGGTREWHLDFSLKGAKVTFCGRHRPYEKHSAPKPSLTVVPPNAA